MTVPLPWQQERWTQLMAAHAAGRLAHALLLAGPRGVGKGRFATALGAWLLCESTGPRKPCGACRSCIQMIAAGHPNLLRLAPAEDKRDIAIDDIRALLERLQLSSHYGQAKVAIIDPADALNASGANALLKTVEEPPANTHILFVAERWRALPATLRSRCQILRFAPPPEAAALAWLKQQQPQLPAPMLRRFARAPLLAQDSAEAAQDEWSGALAELFEGRLQALKLAQGLKRDQARAGLELWLRTGTAWLAHALAPGQAVPADEPFPRGASVAALQQLLVDSLEALRALERNGNPTLLVESIMIRLSQRAASSR